MMVEFVEMEEFTECTKVDDMMFNFFPPFIYSFCLMMTIIFKCASFSTDKFFFFSYDKTVKGGLRQKGAANYIMVISFTTPDCVFVCGDHLPVTLPPAPIIILACSSLFPLL